MAKLIQSEADRRVTGALKTAQEKWQKEMEKRLEDALKEAERLTQLSVEEKKKKELLRKQQEEIARRALNRKELELVEIRSSPAKCHQ